MEPVNEYIWFRWLNIDLTTTQDGSCNPQGIKVASSSLGQINI